MLFAKSKRDKAKAKQASGRSEDSEEIARRSEASSGEAYAEWLPMNPGIVGADRSPEWFRDPGVHVRPEERWTEWIVGNKTKPGSG